jgi:hypothetical protein
MISLSSAVRLSSGAFSSVVSGAGFFGINERLGRLLAGILESVLCPQLMALHERKRAKAPGPRNRTNRRAQLGMPVAAISSAFLTATNSLQFQGLWLGSTCNNSRANLTGVNASREHSLPTTPTLDVKFRGMCGRYSLRAPPTSPLRSRRKTGRGSPRAPPPVGLEPEAESEPPREPGSTDKRCQ